jgi:hypothetical protein
MSPISRMRRQIETAPEGWLGWTRRAERMTVMGANWLKREGPVPGAQVPHFAACFSNKEASMAGRAVGRSITASVIGFMIRANRIVGANP